MIVLIDNYDSFVYNIYQYLSELGEKVKVYRNDEITVAKLRSMKNLKAIVISPGPGRPDNAGCSLEVIEELYRETPMLGICLGHQAIAQVFGGDVIRAKRQLHGKSSLISHNSKGLFKGIPNNFSVIRYHSLIVDNDTFPKSLKITARSDDGYVMSLQHNKYPLYGVQFHPESHMSECGYKIFQNFLSSI